MWMLTFQVLVIESLVMIIRDENDTFVVAKAKITTGYDDALMIKALAFKNALLFAIEIDYKSIVVKSYSSPLIKALKSQQYPCLQLGQIGKKCSKLSECFNRCEIEFVMQKGNKVADHS